MKFEGLPTAAAKSTTPSLLVCASRNLYDSSETGDEFITSPLRCLDAASDGTYSHIVVLFSQKTFKNTDDLVELCISLKHNSHTGPIPLIAVLRKEHGELMTSLRSAGTEYVKIIGEARMTRSILQKLVSELGPRDLLEKRIAPYCPFLHYSRVNECEDMPVCGAYHDILVINDRRFRNYCSVERHLECDYFKNPRKKK